MATISNSGRIILYSIEIDAFLSKNHNSIEKFKSGKLHELISIDSPYTLKAKKGRLLAIKTITEELTNIDGFAQKCFQEARRDIAFSIVAELALRE